MASGPGGISRRGFLGTQTSLPIPRAEPIAVLPRRGWSVGGRSSSSRARSGSTRSGSAGPAILDSPGVTASSTGGGGRQSPPSVCMTATSSPGSSASTGDPAETGERYPAGQVQSAEVSSPARGAASGMATTALGNLVGPLTALLSMPVLAYGLGVDGRGQVAAATAPLLLATTLSTVGIPEAVTYAVAKSPTVLKVTARRGALLIGLAGLLATLVCIVGSNLLDGGQAEIRRLIIVASLALLPTMLVMVLRASAAGLHRWRLVAREQVVSATLRLIGLLAIALFGVLTPMSATIVLVVAPVLGALAYLPLRRIPAAAVEADLAPPTALTRNLLSFGSRIWIGALSGVLLSRLDQVLMTTLSNSFQLGLYAVAVAISDVTLILHGAMRDVTFVADAAGRNDARLCASTRISGFLSLCLGVSIAVLVPIAIPVVFGPDFAPAIGPAFWLLAAVVLATPGSIAAAGLSARGHPGLRALALAIAAAVNLLALVLLVPRMGAAGAAIATLVGNFVASQVNVLFMVRSGRIRMREFYGLRSADLALIEQQARSMVARWRISPGRRAGVKNMRRRELRDKHRSDKPGRYAMNQAKGGDDDGGRGTTRVA